MIDNDLKITHKIDTVGSVEIQTFQFPTNKAGVALASTSCVQHFLFYWVRFSLSA